MLQYPCTCCYNIYEAKFRRWLCLPLPFEVMTVWVPFKGRQVKRRFLFQHGENRRNKAPDPCCLLHVSLQTTEAQRLVGSRVFDFICSDNRRRWSHHPRLKTYLEETIELGSWKSSLEIAKRKESTAFISSCRHLGVWCVLESDVVCYILRVRGCGSHPIPWKAVKDRNTIPDMFKR